MTRLEFDNAGANGREAQFALPRATIGAPDVMIRVSDPHPVLVSAHEDQTITLNIPLMHLGSVATIAKAWRCPASAGHMLLLTPNATWTGWVALFVRGDWREAS